MNPENYSSELEERVLQHIMAMPHHDDIRLQKAMLKLSPDCFYKSSYAEIFAIIARQYREKLPFDFVNILIILPNDRPLVRAAFDRILDDYRSLYVGSNCFEYDVNRLINLANLRNQVRLMQNAIDEVRSLPNPEDAQETMHSFINQISGLNYRESKSGLSTVDFADLYYEGKLIQDLAIPTTSEQLNRALNGGIMPKSLITIAAGAGVGKTGFAIYLLDAISRNQPETQSLFYSLEMEAQHIWMRHIGICGQKLFAKMDEKEKTYAIAKALNAPMQIYDTSMCRACSDIDFIITNSRLKAMEKPISVIAVDYLGLVQNSGKFERNDLKQADITSKLANLALELNCTIIALSQINRSAATRAKDDQCPYPSDAADSSGSHRSSTLWLGVDRPEMYQDDPCYRNQFVIKCRKNRFGDNFELIFAFNNGTFAEVPYGTFKEPQMRVKDPNKALFSAHGKDIYVD